MRVTAWCAIATALKNGEKNSPSPPQRPCRQRLQQIDRHIEALDTEIGN